MSSTPSPETDLTTVDPPKRIEPSPWRMSMALGIGTAILFLANGREIGSWDTIPASLIPLGIVRGDGLKLDRFVPLLRVWGTPLPPFVALSHGHVISRYPVAPAFFALPLVAPQIWWLDRTQPGWDRNLTRLYDQSRIMAKRAAAVITALVAVALYHLFVRLGLRREAPLTVVATLAGSELWTVASQSLWQHGPAALAITLTMLVLSPTHPSRSRLLLAGFTTGALVVCRALDVVFAAVVLAWVARYHRRRLVWFLPGLVSLGSLLLAYNLYYFDHVTGGQAQLEALHRQIHGVGGVWSGDLREGFAGTLFSPSRGLFIYAPWVVLAVVLGPWSVRALPPRSLVRWMLLALVPFLALLSKYSVWWAGGTFGPRYWTDAFPLFGILLACGLCWSKERSVTVRGLLFTLIGISIIIQAIGAFCYPSSWNFYPTDIDLDHARLWDWSDSELSRGLTEFWTGKAPIAIPGR